MSTIIDKTDSLALKLKDAGFPFKEYYLEQHSGKDSELKWNNKFWEYPSLDELIEACGREFGIDSSFKLYYHGGYIQWQAGFWNIDLEDNWKIVQEGTTPVEAVANLWLALNRKS